MQQPSVSEGVASAGQPLQVSGGKAAGLCAAASDNAAAAAAAAATAAVGAPAPTALSPAACCLHFTSLCPRCAVCRIATPWLQPAGLGEFVGEFVPPAVGDHGAQSLLAGGFQGETSGEPRSSALPAALCLSRLTGIDAERQSPHSRTEPQWHLHHCIVLRRPAWRQRRRSRELWFWGDGGSGGQPNGLPAARQRLCTGACVHASCLPACRCASPLLNVAGIGAAQYRTVAAH